MAIELTTASASTLSGIRAYTSALSYEALFPNAPLWATEYGIRTTLSNYGDTVDFSHPSAVKLGQVSAPAYQASLTKIIGGANLVRLENAGTVTAINFVSCGFSAATLNAFFTALPATVRTATINVVGNPGAATCTTSIASNKGYTVVTSS